LIGRRCAWTNAEFAGKTRQPIRENPCFLQTTRRSDETLLISYQFTARALAEPSPKIKEIETIVSARRRTYFHERASDEVTSPRRFPSPNSHLQCIHAHAHNPTRIRIHTPSILERPQPKPHPQSKRKIARNHDFRTLSPRTKLQRLPNLRRRRKPDTA
jgi:hypothetical protein